MAPKNSEALAAPEVVNEQPAPEPPKGKGEGKKSNLAKTKDDAAELSAVADQLRDELNKMNINVLSLDVIQKTEQLEKLAKKLKGDANKH